MSIQVPKSRLIKDAATLTEFFKSGFRGIRSHRVLMVVGKRFSVEQAAQRGQRRGG